MKFAESDLIKVITGVRRCGKSVILEQICNIIKKETDNIVYIDFDDRAQSNFIASWEDIVNFVNKERKPERCYVFLDEIQNIDNWAMAVKSLRREECSVFITGSNSKLLSGEIAREISGRFVSFRIRPFVFREISEYARILNKKYDIQDYIIWGGFPQVLEQVDESAVRRYLNSLDDTIIINDIISRFKIKKVDDFKRVVNFILLSHARIYSPYSISNYMNTNNHSNISSNTIQKWIGYLKEAYIIDELARYSKKAKKELENSKKIYLCDIALNSIRLKNGEYDITHNFENIVFNELLFMDYSLQVYNMIDGEIDFVAQKGNKTFYIQVAYSIVDENTRKREFAPFAKLDNQHKKIIITSDEYDFSTSTVEHIKFKDFVMMDELS